MKILFAVFLLNVVTCGVNSDSPPQNGTVKLTPPAAPVLDNTHQSEIIFSDSLINKHIHINAHSDSLLLKALIAKLSEKDSKGIGELILPFIVAMLPILLGYLGYRYAIRQMIAKQKLDWITIIQSLGSKLITEILKSRVKLNQAYEIQEEIEVLQKEVDAVKREIKNEENDRLLAKKLESPTKKLEAKKIEFEQARQKYYEDFFVGFQLLQEVSINLDINSFRSQALLFKAVERFRSALDDDSTEEPETLINDVIKNIRMVVAEQRMLAEGRS